MSKDVQLPGTLESNMNTNGAEKTIVAPPLPPVPTSSSRAQATFSSTSPLIISSIADYLSPHGQLPIEEPLTPPSERDERSSITNLTTDGVQQLRRKPHLDSNAAALTVESLAQVDSLPRSPSIPPSHVPNNLDQPLLTSRASFTRFISVSKSPNQRKPPASHSSYGVETSLGPPPSYTTQRTLSQDRAWKLEPNTRPTSSGARHTIDSDKHLPEPEPLIDHEILISDPPLAEDISSPETIETQSIATPNELEMAEVNGTNYGFVVHDDESRSLQAYGVMSADNESKESSNDGRKSEDLFLNIARMDGGRPNNKPEPEKRKSRISLPFLHSPRQADISKTRSPASAAPFDPALLSPGTDSGEYFDKRSSLGQHTITPMSSHPLDARSRPSTQSGISRSTSRATRSVLGRVEYQGINETIRDHGRNLSQATNDANARAGRRSSLIGRTHRYVPDSNAIEPPRHTEYNATESTISTTAPSTVWDELDDLKSRIRKLELTGKLPASSAAAMSSAERPRTATTAATTLSSSPKTKPNASSLQSVIGGIPSSIHPLLHEALGQAKLTLSNDVYQKLLASASDALQLVSLVHGDQYAGTGATASGFTVSQERQIRRRTESMCRGLTELTIAIASESKTIESPSYRPGSRASVQYAFVGRQVSNEPSELPPLTSRVQSRLEGRRTSVNISKGRTGYSSPETGIQTPTTLLPGQPGSASGPQRSSTMIRSRRQQGYLDGATDEEDGASSVRPVSRARTDVGSGYKRLARDRTSLPREYTSQHPMPTQLDIPAVQRTPLPAGLGSNFQSRRKYASSTTTASGQNSSPITPSETFGRITVVGREATAAESTPDSISSARGSGSRRSLGLASRIGSSVGSRLRAVRAERNVSSREPKQVVSKNVYPSEHDLENSLPEAVTLS